MRHVLRLACLLAPVIVIQACGHEARDLSLSPVHPEIKDDSGGIGTFGLNECPVASGAVVSAPSGSVNFQLVAMDPDNGPDPLTYLVTAPPLHGTLVVQTATGAASYTASAGYCGPDSFRFRVSDGACSSPEATVTIVVCGPPPDSDGDGVPDADDDCNDSDLGETVLVGDCDTGVANLIDGEAVNDHGCSLADIIHGRLAEAAGGAGNHGQFVHTMARSLTELGRIGLVGVNEHGAIMRCVARADEEDFQP